QQLAFRASEIPVSLVLTNQASDFEPKWVNTIKACLGAHFSHLRINALSRPEAEELVRYLENDPERQLKILQFSGGNPFFMESYAKHKNSFDSAPEPVVAAAVSMLSKLPQNIRDVLKVLSVFRGPVQVKILAALCGTCTSDLEPHLNATSCLGV